MQYIAHPHKQEQYGVKSGEIGAQRMGLLAPVGPSTCLTPF
jgi:hypothetical protein